MGKTFHCVSNIHMFTVQVNNNMKTFTLHIINNSEAWSASKMSTNTDKCMFHEQLLCLCVDYILYKVFVSHLIRMEQSDLHFLQPTNPALSNKHLSSPDYTLQSDFSLSVLSAMWLLKAVPWNRTWFLHLLRSVRHMQHLASFSVGLVYMQACVLLCIT